MNYNFFSKLSFILLTIVILAACDDDLSTVGGQVIDTIPRNGFTTDEFSVTAYSERIKRAQINGFPGVLLGKNKDNYGERTHSALSQLGLSVYNATTLGSAELKNVTISIPYFTTAGTSETTSETGIITTPYTLDSIRNAGGSFKLSLYYYDYFLSSFDESNPANSKVYFNDNNIPPNEADKTLLGTIDLKNISSDEIIIPNGDCVEEGTNETRVAPQLRLVIEDTISDAFKLFADNIINKIGSTELSNDNNFKAFFKSILLKVDQSSEALLYLNLNSATITLNYTEVENAKATDNCEKFVDKSIVLGFSGNILNLVDENFDPTIDAEIQEQVQKKDIGADKLYIKGGNGSIGVIKLFSENPEVLEELKADNVIINDALLRFYLDEKTNIDELEEEELEALMSQRLYIYNYETGEPLADYLASPFPASTTPDRFSYTDHLGPLVDPEDDGNYYYDIKITQHVKNLIFNNESGENPLLGICVTANTKLPLTQSQTTGVVVNQNAIKAVDNSESGGATKIPVGAIIDPDGLVLTGSNTPSVKKLKLLLTYTQPIN